MFLTRRAPEAPPTTPGSVSKYAEETIAVTHARGLLCDTIRQGCLKRYGKEGWAEVMGCLSDAGRIQFAEPVGDFAWVPIALVKELEVAFGNLREEGKPFYQGRDLAEQQLQVVHPWLLKLLSPEMLIRQAPTLFRFYYKGGLLEVEEAHRGHGVTSLWALGMPSGWYVSGAAGWFDKALRMSGAHKVDIQHEAPPVEGDIHRHRYTVLWE